ncbi:30S ribosomal protein S4 [Candidatus Microgenomates bacterium]|nr:30S ribosomal protein S4 [Candidatus Microgenomates bacterium]
MARYTGPKHRLARREGFNVLEKTSTSLERRLNVPPGQHGTKRTRRRLSEFGQQMREKQKVKRIYGVLERQFVKYVKAAQKKKGETGTVLLSILERRLDNVVYKLRLAKTRAFARQLVSHGHILVNGKTVTISSYQIKANDIITLSDKAANIPIIKEALEDKDISLPNWLQRQGPAGKVKMLPTRDDIDTSINEQLIVEYYSR